MLVALSISPHQAPAQEASPWKELFKGKSLEAFSSNTSGWKWVQNVRLASDNPRKLKAEAGEDAVWNGTDGNADDLYTQEKFGDIEIQFEFCLSQGSNSGVKFHGLYEIQLCDSFEKKELIGSDCGGIYPRAELKPRYKYLDQGIPPKQNACKAPGEWQKLEAIFVAPRFDAQGNKTTSAKLVWAKLNDMIIHEDVVLETPTGHNHVKPEMAVGPLMLQGDHGPVAFRNLRVREYKR